MFDFLVVSKTMPKRKRIWVNRKKHDKVVKYAEETEQFLGALNDEMVNDFIEKYNL